MITDEQQLPLTGTAVHESQRGANDKSEIVISNIAFGEHQQIIEANLVADNWLNATGRSHHFSL